MRKIGKFKGIPVYGVLDRLEWAYTDKYVQDKLFIFANELYYCNKIVAKIDRNNNLIDFDESLFEELRRPRGWDEDSAKLMAMATRTAETPSKKEEEPVLSDAERAAAQNDVAGQFMLEWQNNIDNEIAILKSAVAQMEESLNAVG